MEPVAAGPVDLKVVRQASGVTVELEAVSYMGSLRNGGLPINGAATGPATLQLLFAWAAGRLGHLARIVHATPHRIILNRPGRRKLIADLGRRALKSYRTQV